MKINKPAPRWTIHAAGVANAFFLLQNLSTGWYGFAAMSLAGVLLSLHTLHRHGRKP